MKHSANRFEEGYFGKIEYACPRFLRRDTNLADMNGGRCQTCGHCQTRFVVEGHMQQKSIVTPKLCLVKMKSSSHVLLAISREHQLL